MDEPITVLILAAGLGERLMPITSHIPKPLLPIAGKPIIEMILEKVSLLPITGIGINLHHMGRVIEDRISRSAYGNRIIFFPENPILGTGGALKNAERFLSEGTFLVHNSDILSDIDLGRLIEVHRSSGNPATLAVHDFPGFNTVAIDSDGYVTGVGKSLIDEMRIEKRRTFTGIAVYNPEFLRFLPEGVSSIVDSWLAAIKSGCKIGTYDASGCYWSDIGTPAAYVSAVFEKMKEEGETVYIHPTAVGCHESEMDGYVVIEENNVLPENISLRNCIVLPSSVRPQTPVPGPQFPKTFENCIVGPDFEIDLNESEIFCRDDNGILIGTGGSDRKYFRIREGDRSTVLVLFGADDPDFNRHIEYSKFFKRCGIPVPDLLKVDHDKKEAVFEDLGDLSLYSRLKCQRPKEQIETLYQSVVDIAVMIHTDATRHISECDLLKNRIFDYEHLRWETNYFVENFVMRLKLQAPHVITSELNEDFHKLALKVDSLPKAVIHRDFQSQNIMITKGITPRVIDYQGARIGPPAYDIASLLWDPYYRLEEKLRERLLDYYVRKMDEKTGERFDEENFKETLLCCRLQRHMQALGAYGFLSSVKGKRYFLKHVDEGVRLLKEDITIAKDDYPALYELILRFYEAIPFP